MISIPVLSRSTVGFAPQNGVIHWAMVSGHGNKMMTITSGTIDSVSPDANTFLPSTPFDTTTYGLSLNERFVRHRSVVVDTTDTAIESRAQAEWLTLLPDNVEPGSYRFAWRSSVSGGGRILSVSAVSEAAALRDIESVTKSERLVDCMSCPAQDLPYLLAYSDDFIAGTSCIVLADAEYSEVIEYQNSALLGTTILYGAPEDVLPDIELELIRLNSNTVPNRPIVVVGPRADLFIAATVQSSIGIAYNSVDIKQIGRCHTTVDGTNACVVSLAIRLYYENTFGANFETSSTIYERRKAIFRTHNRQFRRVALVVITLLTGLLGTVDFVIRSNILRATKSMNSLARHVSESTSKAPITGQDNATSTEILELLGKQSNQAALMFRLGRARPDGVWWTRLTIARKDAESSAIAIRGHAIHTSSLAEFIRFVERIDFLREVSVSSKSSPSRNQSNSHPAITFELTAIAESSIQ
ncbi:MAG: hypothetical protein HKN43_10790 [Rhodothermales bacterium]|nr:hypothetical protein [Rhodothermales bacterium]